MDMPTNLVPAAENPPDDVQWWTVDNVFIKQMYIAKAGTFIAQHSHCFDHASLLTNGAVRLWKDGKLDREYRAPCCIEIAAGIKHAFEALEDNTTVFCIHNIGRPKIQSLVNGDEKPRPPILEEHHFAFDTFLRAAP